MPDHCKVRLDTTLTDLYRCAGPKFYNKKIGQIPCGASSGIELSECFPRNTKYVYQDSTFNALSSDDDSDNDLELRRSLAIKYLALVPQREAFIAGNTAVFVFSTDQSADQIEHETREFETTLSVLADDQRPRLSLAPGPEHIWLQNTNTDLLAIKVAVDSLEKLPNVCQFEAQYFLNTKAALAQSGLPTPACDIVQLEGYSLNAGACCNACVALRSPWISPRCSGTRGQWLAKSEAAVVSAIKSRALPFVVKGTQTFGGAGTWLVNNEHDRDAVITELTGGILRKLFSSVTAQNEHLKPGSIILSDMVQDPTGNYGLTMFVQEDGSPDILGLSEQIIDAKSAWIGSTITFSKQPALIKKFECIAKQIAAWVHKYDYVGPVGADILETTSTETKSSESKPQFHIVDLNVRTSGSMCLPLLSNHFTSRGFDCASASNLSVKSSRAEFMAEWSTLFDNGQACILSWYQDPSTGVSLADIALGEKDESKLHDLMRRVKESTDDVTF